jgi:hypothetical protein
MRELRVVGLMPTNKLSKVEDQVFDLAVKQQRFCAAEFPSRDIIAAALQRFAAARFIGKTTVKIGR